MRPALLVALLMGTPLGAGAESAPFSGGTAQLVPQGRLELGVFGPARYGLTDGLELSLHPLWFFVAPHVAGKLHLGELGGWTVASTHGLSVPTPLLRLLAREGTGGIIPPDLHIPWVLVVANHLVVSHPVGARDVVTLSAGARLAPHLGKSTFRSVDWYFAYPRTVLVHSGVSLDAGARYDGWLSPTLGVQLELGGFWIPRTEGSFAIEHRARLVWRAHERAQATVGYVLAVVDMPFGTTTSPALPIAELIWAWD